MPDNIYQHLVCRSNQLNKILMEIIYEITGDPDGQINISFSNFHLNASNDPSRGMGCNELLPRSQIHVALLLFLDFHFSQVSVRSNYGRREDDVVEIFVHIFLRLLGLKGHQPPTPRVTLPPPSCLHLHPTLNVHSGDNLA